MLDNFVSNTKDLSKRLTDMFLLYSITSNRSREDLVPFLGRLPPAPFTILFLTELKVEGRFENLKRKMTF